MHRRVEISLRLFTILLKEINLIQKKIVLVDNLVLVLFYFVFLDKIKNGIYLIDVPLNLLTSYCLAEGHQMWMGHSRIW
jgi:hypothetical protein